MNKNVFSICGFSCAGKSTLITNLINTFQFTTIRYGDIHREAIKKSGYKLGMDWVKDKGFEEYEKGTLEILKTKMDNCPSENIIIDGIFSKECFKYLKSNKNLNVTNILLKTTFDNRLKRMMKREKYSFKTATQQLTSVDWLKFNSGLNEIMKQADYIIDSGQKSEFEITKIVIQIIGDIMKNQEKEFM